MEDQRVNVPLLRKAVEWAEAEAAKPPELCEWAQDVYILPNPVDRGSFAATYWTRPDTAQTWAESEWQVRAKATECGTCFCIAGFIAHEATGNLDYSKAQSIALTALGLSASEIETSDRYDDLFSPTNTIEDVRRIAESLAGERL